jgi:hypothetical protein
MEGSFLALGQVVASGRDGCSVGQNLTRARLLHGIRRRVSVHWGPHEVVPAPCAGGMGAMPDVTEPISTQRWLFRLGAVAAVVGSLAGSNLIHPATPLGDPSGVARAIADSLAWTPIHLIIVTGIMLMLGGLLGLYRSIPGGLAGALAQFGWAAAIAGVAVGLVLVMLDGVAAKQLADEWARAPAAEQWAALRVVFANETTNFALASLFNILFAGADLHPVRAGRRRRLPPMAGVGCGDGGPGLGGRGPDSGAGGLTECSLPGPDHHRTYRDHAVVGPHGGPAGSPSTWHARSSTVTVPQNPLGVDARSGGSLVARYR